jgi:hypothetical protein
VKVLIELRQGTQAWTQRGWAPRQRRGVNVDEDGLPLSLLIAVNENVVGMSVAVNKAPFVSQREKMCDSVNQSCGGDASLAVSRGLDLLRPRVQESERTR